MRLIDHWQHKEYTGMKLGLERMRSFLARTGNPERTFKSVHIAGTNGKGSTAVMAAALFSSLGFRTGLYTSPHLVRVNERFMVDGIPISDRDLGSLSRRHDAAARKCGLTFFEYITGLAFHYFAQKKVDIAVLETGLGGRFDATNVIEKPLVSIITDIDYDHQAVLGSRLTDIAFEKAGIIKAGVPVISGALRKTARKIITATARKRRSPLFELGQEFSYSRTEVDWKALRQCFTYRGINRTFPVLIRLMGAHQVKNGSLALAAVEAALGGCSFKVSAIQRGMRRAFWPARFEVRRREKSRQTIILDGAHNPAGSKRLVQTYRQSSWGRRKAALIFGVLKDKYYRPMVRSLSSVAGRVFIIEVHSPRRESRANMQREWRRYLKDAEVVSCASLEDALKESAALKNMPVIVTGSLYLMGDTLKFLKRGRL